MDTKITKQDIEWLEKELKKVNEGIKKVNNEIAILITTKENLENTLKMFKEKIKNEK